MSREYKAVLEIKGVQKAVYRSESLFNIKRWIEDQNRVYRPHLKEDKDWEIYYLTESQPNPKKADFKLPRIQDLSEQEKTVSKYL